MKRNRLKLLGGLLSLGLMFTSVVSTPAQMSVQASTVQEYAVASEAATDRDIQDGVTLQCWNWSYKNIEANMAKIAELGYTAIQTSPIQQAKESTAGKVVGEHWWVYYQPGNFVIDNTGNSALGTKAETTTTIMPEPFFLFFEGLESLLPALSLFAFLVLI